MDVLKIKIENSQRFYFQQDDNKEYHQILPKFHVNKFFEIYVVKLFCFQEGDDDQEDSIEVERKKKLGEEANSKNIVTVNCTQ